MYNGAGKEERDMGDVTKAAVDDAEDAAAAAADGDWLRVEKKMASSSRSSSSTS